MVQRQWTDFSAGVIQVTGNPLDIALGGPGFLSLRGPNGTLYTRNGSLKITPSGELASADGYPLLSVTGSTIQVAAGKPIDIASDGEVSQGAGPLGQIQAGQPRRHGEPQETEWHEL